MTDEAHAMRHKIQMTPVGGGVHKLMGRRENLSPCSAAADRAARPLLDLLDHTKKVHKLGVRLTQNPHPAQIADIALIISPGIEGKDVTGLDALVGGCPGEARAGRDQAVFEGQAPSDLL